MKIGYARVSTEEQNPGLRKNALKAAGGRVIIEDQGVSGAARERTGLGEAIGKLKKGDVLVVWRLDRLGRWLGRLIEIIDGIGKAGAGFASLPDPSKPPRRAGVPAFTWRWKLRLPWPLSLPKVR